MPDPVNTGGACTVVSGSNASGALDCLHKQLHTAVVQVDGFVVQDQWYAEAEAVM